MKFLHTSDWHLGRQFHNISLLEDQEFVLEQIIHYIHFHKVDAVLIAGDIYDRAIPPVGAINLLNSFLEKICLERKIPVIMISGNHDSLERINFASKMMKDSGLHIISDLSNITNPISIEDVDIYGIPYCDPDLVNNFYSTNFSTHHDALNFLVEKIKDKKNLNNKSILLSHCFVNGCTTSESERQISVGGADLIGTEIFDGFDYVALGHLHAPQFHTKKSIRYSGSILKYSFSELLHSKSITCVEVDNKDIHIQELPLKPRFDLDIIEDSFDIILEKAKVHPNKENYFLIRIKDDRAILDPMNKIREFLPNVLQIEKVVLKNIENNTKREKREKRSEIDMFKDFYFQMSGAVLTETEEEILLQTIKEINHSEEKN